MPKVTLNWISPHEELWQRRILDRLKKCPLGQGVMPLVCGGYLRSLERSRSIINSWSACTGQERNGCVVIDYPGSHLRFSRKLPGAIECSNAKPTIPGLRLNNSAIKSPRLRERVSRTFVVMPHLMRNTLGSVRKPLLLNSSLSEQNSVT